MRVLHLIQYLDIGGIERLVQTLVRIGRDNGIHSVVAAYSGDGPMRETFEAEGAEVVLLGPREGRRIDLLASIGRLLSERDVDVLHTHHLGPFIYGVVPALTLGVGHVHTEHSVEFYDTIRRREIGRHMGRVARVACVSDKVAAWRHEHLGVSPETVIENGVNIPQLAGSQRARARSELGLSQERFVIGCVARLAAEKDHATLLGGFERLLSEGVDAELVLVGTGPEDAAIRGLSEAPAMRGRVRLLGARNDVDAILPAFDVVTLTSTREGLPLALLEAMAHQKPIVATAVGGVTSLLSEGGGVLVSSGNTTELADAFSALASAPSTRAEMGARAQKVIAGRYSALAMSERYFATYRESRKRGRA